ncbi:MAG: glycosyltransferase family 2 protein [Clostridiales bacterium]|nr:glycosyltransferase family 2 protein [Clostridiales bacterium]
MSKKLSVVVSVYNEEAALPLFYQTTKPILEALPWDWEILFVNDGSVDGSLTCLREFAARESRVKLVSFSRNFGHEAAMLAGIDHASGDGIVCMDADLQHPPECLPEIVAKLEEGCGVISMVRTRNASAGLLKNITSAGFYWVINRLAEIHLEPNASDFFALSRQAADVLRMHYREKVRFLRGYVQNIGFHRVTIEYEARDRVAGESKYSLRKLFAFSMNAILCFSNLPLRLGIFAGIFAALCGVAVMIYTLCTRGGAPSGYATIVIVNCFMFAMLFVIVGIIGEYIAILFSELKDRPLYIVEEKENL